MANIYALFLGVVASASLMAAYGDPSTNTMNPGNPGTLPGNPGSRPGQNPGSNQTLNQNTYDQRSPSYNQGTNPNYNQGSNSSHYPDTNSSFRNPQFSDNNPDYRVNVQRDPNVNVQSSYSNQPNTMQRPVNGNGDAQVLSQIQDRIKGAYKQYNINVNVSNGIATLTGSVNSQLDKDAIEKDIRNVPGISKVNNQLTIQR